MYLTTNMDHTDSFPWDAPTMDTIKVVNPNDVDDDDGEEDFILLQMNLVPKKFTVKQEIKVEQEDDNINVEYLYPEEGEIIEGHEIDENECSETLQNNVDAAEEALEQELGLQEDSSISDYDKQKAELEQKIKDVKEYYSLVSSMCYKLDAFIKSVDEKLAYTEQLNMSFKKDMGKTTDLPNVKCSGLTHVFGAPYFKDKHFFTAPKNYDAVQKELKHEINLYSFPNTHLWKPYEKQKMAQAIKKVEVQKRMDFCRRRMKELSDQLPIADNDRRSEIEDELSDLKGREKLIEQLTLGELVHGKLDEYDWLKISVTDLCSQHSPEECRSMWFAILHPDINKGDWVTEEKKILCDLAAQNNFQNWSLIAEQLGTGRSAFQCICFYQMNLNDQLTRRKWTEDEDKLVQQMVERYRVGTFIPWARVAANVEGRTKLQVFSRWKYCLEPSIIKGRFTEEEDLMILAAMKWYGKNFQQISRFVPCRTSIQLRDRFNASLERSNKYLWDSTCDEKLIEMVEEFGSSEWSFISRSFPGFSKMQIRHRYSVLKKWRETHGSKSFPPVRNHTLKRKYDNKLEDVLGSYVNISEEKAAVMGDTPLFQIQNKLGLQHRKKRGHAKFRAKRKKYSTALDILYLKHFSVSYHCHRSTSKRFVDKEMMDEDGKILKSLLTILNATLNLPDEEDIKMHSDLRNQEDEYLVEYLRYEPTENEEMLENQEAGESFGNNSEIIMTDIQADMTGIADATEVATTSARTAITDMLGSLLPKKCNYSLAMYVGNRENINLPQKCLATNSPAHSKYRKGSAASSLSSMLPQKCSYSLAESFSSNTKKRRGHSSLVPSDPLDISGEQSLIRLNGKDVHRSISFVENNSDEIPITHDSSVPIDNGITIRWCLIPNYATLIGCKTMLLCNAPLSRTVDKSKKWKKAEELRKEDKVCTKKTLENIVKSDDPLALQEMLSEFDVDPNENYSSEKSSFTFAEADALCKQRFVSIFLFPALVSIRNLKVCYDVFELFSSDNQSNCRMEEAVNSGEIDGDRTVSRDFGKVRRDPKKLAANRFMNFCKSTRKENSLETRVVGKRSRSKLNAGPLEENVKKIRNGKRKFEDKNALYQITIVPKKIYSTQCSANQQTRKSERLKKPVKHDIQHVYD